MVSYYAVLGRTMPQTKETNGWLETDHLVFAAETPEMALMLHSGYLPGRWTFERPACVSKVTGKVVRVRPYQVGLVDLVRVGVEQIDCPTAGQRIAFLRRLVGDDVTSSLLQTTDIPEIPDIWGAGEFAWARFQFLDTIADDGPKGWGWGNPASQWAADCLQAAHYALGVLVAVSPTEENAYRLATAYCVAGAARAYLLSRWFTAPVEQTEIWQRLRGAAISVSREVVSRQMRGLEGDPEQVSSVWAIAREARLKADQARTSWVLQTLPLAG